MPEAPAAGTVNGNGERCPECDAADSWQATRRHRFSPFGAVLLGVLAFWTAVVGWATGFGYLPSGGLAAAALVVAVATRKAQLCNSCGFVRPTGH